MSLKKAKHWNCTCLPPEKEHVRKRKPARKGQNAAYHRPDLHPKVTFDKVLQARKERKIMTEENENAKKNITT